MTQNLLNLEYPEAARLKERIAKADRHGNFGEVRRALAKLREERIRELRDELLPKRRRKTRGRRA